MAFRSNPNTGTFDVAVTLAFAAGAAAMSASEMKPVVPNTGVTVPEQAAPVTELYPEADVQPTGKLTPTLQDTPVTGLNPDVDIQPAGKVDTLVAQDTPVVALNPAVDVQPAGKFVVVVVVVVVVVPTN